MIITETGKYRLLKDIVDRTSISISTIKAGTVINITQIDDAYQKVIGKPLSDWVYWELPVEKV